MRVAKYILRHMESSTNNIRDINNCYFLNYLTSLEIGVLEGIVYCLLDACVTKLEDLIIRASNLPA
jgi:hypothetical protein